MIGHYLLTLDPAAEDRVLTQPLTPGTYLYNPGPGYGPVDRCLVGVASDYCVRNVQQKYGEPTYQRFVPRPWLRVRSEATEESVEERYDELCDRFGDRVNAAIRSRILTNRLWRTLKAVPVPHTEQVPHAVV